jgi:hypothetical protein
LMDREIWEEDVVRRVDGRTIKTPGYLCLRLRS